MTLWFVPQWPVKNRYPEEWIQWFPEEFERLGMEEGKDYKVVIPYEHEDTSYNKQEGDMFTSLIESSNWEMEQIKILLKNVKRKDKILFADLDFPGFSATCAQLLKNKYSNNITITGYMHAGCYCKGDYFNKIIYSKIISELAMVRIVDKIFIATDYHKQLFQNNVQTIDSLYSFTDKLVTVKIPYYRHFRDKKTIPIPRKNREWDIAYTSRIDSQKSDEQLLNLVECLPGKKFVVTSKPSKSFPNLEYVPVHNRTEYFRILANSKILFVPWAESTFGYNVLEAIDFGCAPCAPNYFSYPEILGKKYLCSYMGISNVIEKIEMLNNDNRDISFNFKPYEDCIKNMVRLIK